MNVESNLIILGCIDVGKTSLVNSIDGQPFRHETTTVGVDIKNLELASDKGSKFSFKIFDFPGHTSNVNAIPDSYYRDADVVFFVYDATRRNTFDGIDDWNTKVNLKCKNFPLKFLISNKNDVEMEEIRVENRKAKVKAARLKLDVFHEVSAKSGDGVEDLQRILANLMVFRQEEIKKSSWCSIL